MLLLADGGLDDGRVVGVRDQADDNVDLLYLGVEGVVFVDIELGLLALARIFFGR
jgi:hypothetical protein